MISTVIGLAVRRPGSLVAPVIMAQACVACHNAHPESPKRDWKVGDVRGMQEVTITQPIGGNIFRVQISSGLFRARRRWPA